MLNATEALRGNAAGGDHEQLRALVMTLLESLGTRGEIGQYLRAFAAVDKDRFAVIKIGGGILQNDLQALASSLSVLARLGLLPIVVHGAGPQLDRSLARRGIACPRVDGMRYTSPEALLLARRVIQDVNLGLVAALERYGVSARPIVSGVLEAEPIDEERYGLVGAVHGVDLGPVRAAIRAGAIPVVSSFGETNGGQRLNINADVAARAIAWAAQPSKVVFLTPTGGLLDERGGIVPAINIAADDDVTAAGQPWGSVSGGMAVKLREIARLLDGLPPASTVSITAPQHLVRELFTHRGRGTLVRRPDPVEVHSGLAALDGARLCALLEAAFDRPLLPDALARLTLGEADGPAVYLTPSYSAVAIVKQGVAASYLDKFAVTAEAQGQGLGTELWRAVRASHKSLYWRVRSGNPIVPWYVRQSDGMQRSGDWLIFWYGLDDESARERACRDAVARPSSFVEGAGN